MVVVVVVVVGGCSGGGSGGGVCFDVGGLFCVAGNASLGPQEKTFRGLIKHWRVSLAAVQVRLGNRQMMQYRQTVCCMWLGGWLGRSVAYIRVSAAHGSVVHSI